MLPEMSSLMNLLQRKIRESGSISTLLECFWVKDEKEEAEQGYPGAKIAKFIL